MLDIALKINPFSNEISVKKNDKAVKHIDRISGFYKSFLQTSLNLAEIIRNDENEDEFRLELSTSIFEKLFWSVLSAQLSDDNLKVQVLRKDFLVNTSLAQRVEKLLAIRQKFLSSAPPISPFEIGFYASDATKIDGILKNLQENYPWLSAIGIQLMAVDKVSQANIHLFSSVDQVESNEKLLSALTHDIVPLVFVTGSDNLPAKGRISSPQNETVIWELPETEIMLVLKAFLERYFIGPQLNKIIANLAPVFDFEQQFEDYVEFTLLDKFFETLVLHLPETLEKGVPVKVPYRTFFGQEQVDLKVISTFPDIVEAIVEPGNILLKPLEVGNSDIRVELCDRLASGMQVPVQVIDYGYATSVQILADGAPEKRFIMTPGSQLKLGLKIEPQTVKATEDAQNVQWIVSNEQCGQVDPRTMMFYAKDAGNVKVIAKLARVQAALPIIIKPNVADINVALINAHDDHIVEAKKDASGNSVNFVRCYIAARMVFSVERHPENAINAPLALEFSEGISVVKNSTDTEFVVMARRISKKEMVKISLPGCKVVKTIFFDVVANPGTLKDDNKSAMMLGVSVFGLAAFWLSLLFLPGYDMYLLTFSVLVALFDCYAVYKSDKNGRIFSIVLLVCMLGSIAYWLWFSTPSIAGNYYSGTSGRLVESANGQISSAEAASQEEVQLPEPPAAPTESAAATIVKLPNVSPELSDSEIQWVKGKRRSLYLMYLKAQEQLEATANDTEKIAEINDYNEIVATIRREYNSAQSASKGDNLNEEKKSSGFKEFLDILSPAKKPDIIPEESELLEFAETQQAELFKQYKKQKRSVRNCKILLARAQKYQEGEEKVSRTQRKLDQAVKKLAATRQQLIKLYNQKYNN